MAGILLKHMLCA